MSTGVYRFPVERACRIALREIREYLDKNDHLDRVVIVCFGNDVYQTYSNALAEALQEEQDKPLFK